jgi:hypothetical protein
VDSWSKLWALSAREKCLIAQTLLVLPINGLAVHLTGFNRWQAILSRLAPVDRTGAEAPPESVLDRVHQVARMVRVAALHGPYRGSCLQQSLTLWWLLRRQKIESDIRFGARREDGKIEAHAWVEFRGFALNEDASLHHSFTPFECGMTHAEAKTQ